MHKKVIAIAIAGAMAAPLAAQAGEAAIYGKMHVSVDVFDNDDTGAGNEDSSTGVSSNSSRIGFKGSEDLGGGMKAVWQVENDAKLTEDSGEWASRNSYAGLSGGFGTVLIGNHDTPLKDIRVDFFGDTIGDNRAVLGLEEKVDMRTGNTIAYVSPSMNGLEFIGAYVTDTDKGTEDNNDNDAFSASLTYDAGPLSLGGAYQTVSEAASDEDVDTWRITAGYEMGAVEVGALWQSNANEGHNDGKDRDFWSIGAAFGMGNNTLKAQYAVADEHDDYATVSGDETGATKWAIGLDHKMSKKTKLYAIYSSLDNDDGQNVSLTNNTGHGDAGPNAGSIVAGSDPSAFSVGMVHKF